MLLDGVLPTIEQPGTSACLLRTALGRGSWSEKCVWSSSPGGEHTGRGSCNCFSRPCTHGQISVHTQTRRLRYAEPDLYSGGFATPMGLGPWSLARPCPRQPHTFAQDSTWSLHIPSGLPQLSTGKWHLEVLVQMLIAAEICHHFSYNTMFIQV